MQNGTEQEMADIPELSVHVLELEMVQSLRRIAEMIEVVSVRQKKPLGLGHAVLCARDLVGDEPFAVLLSDDLIDSSLPCLRQLLEVFENKKESVIALRRVPDHEVQRYGIVQGKQLSNRLYEVDDMVEKPRPDEAPSRLAIIGRYILQPKIFSLLEKVTPGRGGEIQLTDAIAQLARQKKVYGYEFDGEHYDIGDKLGFVRATIAYALKRPELKEAVKEYLRTVISNK